MSSSQKNRVRPSIEALEHRHAPAALTVSPPGLANPDPHPVVGGIAASAGPGLATADLHGGGMVLWSLAGAQVHAARSAAGHSHARPFHAEDSGNAVFNPDGTISASASGTATHLGAFTLHDTSRIVGAEGAVIYIEGEADLEAADGDHLYASFTGTVSFATLAATVTFEWTGGTGRFADATGTTVWHLSLNPDLTYTAVADGEIDY